MKTDKKSIFIILFLIAAAFFSYPGFAQVDQFPGTALYFDGSSHYVDVPNDSSVNLTNNFSIEAWIKPEAFHSLGGIVSKCQTNGSFGYAFRHTASSPYNGLEFTGWATTTGLMTVNEWYHVALVFKWDSPHFYINGVEHTYSGGGYNIYETTDPLTIGVDFLHAPRFFKGLIDEVSIWNKPLSPQEIRECMNLPHTGTETGLISYWQFNDTSGTVATDHVGTNNGTLKNMDDSDWKPSTIPFGDGHSTTQTVSATGNVSFLGTGVEMDFTSKADSDDIVVTRINTATSTVPDNCQIPFEDQYWIIQQYGSGSFTASLSFTIAEDLSTEDEANPSHISLYRRDAFGGSEWVRAYSATTVDAANNKVTFEGIDEFGQFLLGRHVEDDPPIALSTCPGTGGMLLSLSELKIEFNEIVTQVEGKAISLFHANGIPVLTYYIPESNISGSGSKSITINLGNVLEPGSYYVVVDEGAFQDLSLNNFAGYQGSDAWPFTIKASTSITADTTWAGDVFVYMDFFVEDSVTLCISPGSNIQFGGHYKIDVKGRLLAIGTQTDSIHFFPASGTMWNRIVFNQTPATNDTSKISYCIIEKSHANAGGIHNDGGAIYIDNVSKLLIEHSRISHNHADNYGGGIYCKDANPVIRNNIISHNWGQIDGGGISMFNSNPSLVNNLIIYNDGNNSGGGMSFYGGSNPHVLNTTFSENHIGNGGGAVSFDRGSSPVFTNCIFYNNHSTYGAKEVDISPVGTNEPDFYYCIMQGGTAGFAGSYHGNYENSLDTDPLFVKTGNQPFSLLRTSLGINGGDPATASGDVGKNDLIGNPRFRHGRIDMGAYENSMAPDGFAGTAIEFDGVDDWIDCGNDTSLNISEAITVEAWIKPVTMMHNNSILQKGNIHLIDWDYQLESISGKGIQINLPGPNTGWWEFQYDMDYGKWYHIAWTFSSEGELVAYVNGEIARQGEFPGSIQINTDHLKIAAIENAHSYKGLMDEIRIWNTVRTRQQIRENMYLTFPENKADLLTYWQFNTGQGNILADINGSNRGILQNISDSAWVESTIPFGKGNSESQQINSTGNKLFPNTAVELNFVAKTGIDTVTICKIDTLPNLPPLAGESVLGNQYWEVNQFGNGTFSANMSLTFDEDLVVYDELNPSTILLFTRNNTSDSSWIFTRRASSVDAQNNIVTFDSVTAFGQFIVSKNEFDSYPGTALTFDIDGGLLEFTNEHQFDFDTAFTIETWINIDTMSEDFHTILSKGSAWVLRMIYSNDAIVLEFVINEGEQELTLSYLTDTATMLGKWNHLACVYQWEEQNRDFSLYFNGIKCDVLEAADLIPNNHSVIVGEDFSGTLDELRFWNTARTTQQIRESMHLVLDYPFNGLLSNFQLNEGDGINTKDPFGGNLGTLTNFIPPAGWVPSDIPFGGGQSNTQTEQSGSILFADTDVTMDFISSSGASITVSKIDTAPNINPDTVDIFDCQYWIIERYGEGGFYADMVFSPAEKLQMNDMQRPGQIKLYYRNQNARTDWMLIDSADQIDLNTNSIRFNEIERCGQFIIGRSKQFSGYPGHALFFDGEKDYVYGSGIDTNLSAFTIETWVKHDTLPPRVQRYITLGPETVVLRYDGTIYGGYQQLHFYIRKPNGHLQGIRVDSVIIPHKWLHVAGTFDGTQMKLYLNGELLDSSTLSSSLYPPDGNFSFSHSVETMSGELDELRIWNYARSKTQIRESMHRVINWSEKGLINYWQFNEGSGSVASDTVNGLQGVIHNLDPSTCWHASSIPAGEGIANTQVVSTTGNIEFHNTGLNMDFTAKTGTDSVTVTKIMLSPNLNPLNVNSVYDAQYWIIDDFGAQDFISTITFTLSEDLVVEDEVYTSEIKLYGRDSNCDGSWIIIDSASSVDAVKDLVTFQGISHFSQFILAKKKGNHLPPGNCLKFDGIDDYVNILADTSLNLHEFTVEYWIKMEQATPKLGVIDKGFGINSDWYFLTGGPFPKGITFGFSNGNVTHELIGGWTDSDWHHISGTYDGATLRLYIDGENYESVNMSDLKVSTNNIFFGNRRDGGYFFEGELDEIRIWREARTLDQIRENMHRPLNGDEPNLVSYWSFNESSGRIAHDLSSSNNGTLYNMLPNPWVNSTAPAPYFTIANGDWESTGRWALGQNAPAHTWARVRVEHKIHLNSSYEIMDLIINSEGVLTVLSGFTLTISP